jgi:hypothetical protein
MEWQKEDVLVLANGKCSVCGGTGLRTIRKRTKYSANTRLLSTLNKKREYCVPCECVLRKIFHICYDHFIQTYYSARNIGWARNKEEFIADFWITTKRSLSEFEFHLFYHHFILEEDYNKCCLLFDINKGKFFNTIYSMEQKLGRIYKELRPYALYPIYEYYGLKHVLL